MHFSLHLNEEMYRPCDHCASIATIIYKAAKLLPFGLKEQKVVGKSSFQSPWCLRL